MTGVTQHHPLTLAIRNARIVDGTGAPARSGDVAVADDRIVATGRFEGRAAREIDARGRIVAPGFIDIHTHYDPQLCWDRLATPTPEHGVTSLVMGNCSVTLAPVRPEHRGRIIKLFGSVEDIEGSLLESTVPFSWETFGEYLDYLSAGLGPNVGVFVGHAPLRMYVMGNAAQQRVATEAEIATLCEHLRSALSAGAIGLSFSCAHLDEHGQPLPCAYAHRREMRALLQAIAAEGRGVVQAVVPSFKGPQFALDYIDQFGALALETGVMCTLSPLLYSPFVGDLWERMLSRFEHWQARGARLYSQAQTRPLDMTVQLSKGSAVLGKTANWRQVMDLPVSQRVEQLSDPAVRKLLRPETEHNAWIAAFTVRHAHSDANARYLGRRLRDVADEEARPLFDVLADIALADGLETEFAVSGLVHADPVIVGKLLDHPAVHIGSGDAGAHINQFSGAGDTSYLFEKFVRQERMMSVERAVQRLTSDLARAWRIEDRGEIAPGKFADLVIFDPDTISRGEEAWVGDVPGNNGRYVRRPQGVEQVIVNGSVLVDRGSYTDARPGRII
jgi:N-acyl-D-amino-acid deacylase